MTVATVIVAIAAGVQAAAAVVIVVLTRRLVQTTERYTSATQDLAKQTTAMAAATRELAVQAAAEGETSRRMAEAMAKTAEETARQARLQHLERYTQYLDKALNYCADAGRGFNAEPDEARRERALATIRDVIEGQARAIPEPTRSYLLSAVRFLQSVIDNVGTMSAAERGLAIDRFSRITENDMRAVMRGEDQPPWSLPDGADVVVWARSESSRLGAPPGQ